jgi:hypothetical protein
MVSCLEHTEESDQGDEEATNAYMLVYIREVAIDEVLAPLTEQDTPHT